jgi:hypothetical protein
MKTDQVMGALSENLLSGIQNLIQDNPFAFNKKQENKKEDKSKTPTLDFYSTDLTAEAKD